MPMMEITAGIIHERVRQRTRKHILFSIEMADGYRCGPLSADFIAEPRPNDSRGNAATAWQEILLEAKDSDDTALGQRQAAHGCAAMEPCRKRLRSCGHRTTARKEPNSPPQRQPREAFSLPGTCRSLHCEPSAGHRSGDDSCDCKPGWSGRSRANAGPGQSNSSGNPFPASKSRSLCDRAACVTVGPVTNGRNRQIFHDFASPHAPLLHSFNRPELSGDCGEQAIVVFFVWSNMLPSENKKFSKKGAFNLSALWAMSHSP